MSIFVVLCTESVTYFEPGESLDWERDAYDIIGRVVDLVLQAGTNDAVEVYDRDDMAGGPRGIYSPEC